MRRVAHQLAQGLQGAAAHPPGQPCAVGFVQLQQHVGGAVIGHAFQQRSGTCIRHPRNQVAGALQLGAVEHVDDAGQRQARNNVGGRIKAAGIQGLNGIGNILRCKGQQLRRYRLQDRGHGSPL